MKVFTGYTGPFPKATGHEFDGLKKALEQDEKLWVDKMIVDNTSKLKDILVFKPNTYYKFVVLLREKDGKTLLKSYNKKELIVRQWLVDSQEKLDEINEKISKVDFDPTIKKENDKRELEGSKRNYYSYILPFCPFNYCPKQEALEDIIKEKEETEKKMDKLINDSKEHISEYFGGAAFITFNTIKQQEEYCKKLPNNFFDYIGQFFKQMLDLFCSC